MPGYLTTHVLDTARGCPAEGLRIALFRLAGEARTRPAERRTNAGGRTDAPILPQGAFAPGGSELVCHAGDFLRGLGLAADFLDVMQLRFSVTEASHYHVLLLLSPYAYSTCRGS